MKCAKIKKILDLYFEKELPETISAEIKEHLKYCGVCRQEAERYSRFTKRLSRTVAAPQEFAENIRKQLNKHKTEDNRKNVIDIMLGLPTLYRNLVSLSVAAVVLLMLLPQIFKPGEVVVPEEETKVVTFTLVRPEAHTVAVSGDFTTWNTVEMQSEDSTSGKIWTITLTVKPGRYQYGFIVDNQEWVEDPYAERCANDGYGNKNAIIEI